MEKQKPEDLPRDLRHHLVPPRTALAGSRIPRESQQDLNQALEHGMQAPQAATAPYTCPPTIPATCLKGLLRQRDLFMDLEPVASHV